MKATKNRGYDDTMVLRNAMPFDLQFRLLSGFVWNSRPERKPLRVGNAPWVRQALAGALES